MIGWLREDRGSAGAASQAAADRRAEQVLSAGEDARLVLLDPAGEEAA
jgi:hypothetical protein